MPLGIDFSAMRNTLANRNFAVYTAGNGVSLIGTWVQRVAVGWVTWDLTHSATWLGAVSMAEFVPVIFLAPIMGVMADRFDPRRIAVLGQILAAFQSLALAALTLSGTITAPLILALQIFSGVIQPLIQTARLVLVPTLVPRDNVGNAVALTSLMFNIARVVGPAVSGVLIAAVGAGFSFAFNAFTYSFVIAALVSLKLPLHQPAPRSEVSLLRGIWDDVAAGWKYTFTHPTLQWVIPLVTVSGTLTWPVGDLLAGVADHEFNRGVGALAIFTTAHGIGAVLGGLYLAQRKNSEGMEEIMIWSILLNGLFMVAFGVTKIFWIAVPLYGLSGMFLLAGGASSQTVAQTVAREDMRGRTMSIWFTLTRLGPAAGAMGLGTLASLMGFTIPLAAGGLITAISAALVWKYRKKPV